MLKEWERDNPTRVRVLSERVNLVENVCVVVICLWCCVCCGCCCGGGGGCRCRDSGGVGGVVCVCVLGGSLSTLQNNLQVHLV